MRNIWRRKSQLKKFEIKVFTLYSKIWYNHAFLPLSQKWKARLTILRPCFLSPSWKCFKVTKTEKVLRRLESYVMERRIATARCENETGSFLAHKSVQAWSRKFFNVNWKKSPHMGGCHRQKYKNRIGL